MTQKEIRNLLNYEPDTGYLRWKVARNHNCKVGEIAGCIRKDNGYRVINIKGKTYRAHRLVWLYVYGSFPEKSIDHINRNKDDNRLSNLREATQTEQNRNMPNQKNNKSGLAGIHFNERLNKWTAFIYNNGKRKHLGTFADKYKAIAKRLAYMTFYGYHKTHGGLSHGSI